ncbi:equilibrative nucleoside transporter 3-like isoform X2 [Mya arenaria]|uniref:equilibrative nucleoside transporter 3-like isoform X2 n=1 Tax=Mya arenaria TaxID=6604 RepID=UPI0022E91E63|nr:equilibrative nucleoside transporter 3-like isoform X2 [Mya arenaria]
MDTSEDPLLPQAHGPIPKDRFHMVYFIFYLLGLGSLIPWNFFITASEYFKFKFRNTTLPDDEYLDPEHETDLQAMFESYLTLASTAPNLLFNLITTLLISRIGLKVRMSTALFLITSMFVLTASLVKMNTDSWQDSFFWITMITAVFINIGSSILGASLFGVASLFPSHYMQATMSGQAMGGIFAAVANLVTLALGSDVVDSGLGFFLFATFMSICTLIGYASLYCINYSRYHILEIGEDTVETRPTRSNGSGNTKLIIKRIWKEGLSVCLIFLVTVSCFPAVASSVVSVNNTDWTEKYFSGLVCFLLFNAGDWAGRSVAGTFKRPGIGKSNLLLVLSVMRVVFIPLIMFCNAQPRHDPVIFNSDAFPVIFIMLLGLTNGYLGTLAMMYGPSMVMAEHAEMTGAIMATCLTSGLVSGSLMAILLMKSL